MQNQRLHAYHTQLMQQLAALGIDEAAADFIRGRVEWVDLAAGKALMRQDDAGDSAFLVIRGRLRVYVADGSEQRFVRELARGAVIGEMSLYTGEPRSATVIAVRESLLVKLRRRDFEELLRVQPQVSIALTRQVIERLRSEHLQRPLPAPVTVAVVGISNGVDAASFSDRLAAHLRRFGSVRVAGPQLQPRADGGGDDANGLRDADTVARAIDELEATHDFVLLCADEQSGPWSQACLAHADEILLLADASAPPAIHPIEQTLLDRADSVEAAQILVLLHPEEQRIPRGTRRWLQRRSVTSHLHLRPALESDMARMARLLSRNAIGLVFAGGGARGFAHLGVWRALKQQGVEVDCIGGTSIGAVMAALVAADPPVDSGIEVARRAFRKSPTSDYNLVPLLSLIGGRRVRQAIDGALQELVGGSIDIEDLWKPFFCIASNYSKAREQPITSGDLGAALRASIAIPGALPPVVFDGDLLCDGGTFNNFPVDVMRSQRGVGRVIGVDLGARNPRRIEFEELPGSWALLWDRLRPRSKRRYRVPSLVAYLLNVQILYSSSRQQYSRALADLCFEPPLQRVGLLQWARFDHIVRQGHEHAAEVLAALDASQQQALGLSAESQPTARLAAA